MNTSASRQIDAHGKALALNLDGSFFGTLAEILAGQEVACWFLTVGGASGSIAKTISAYDKIFSDEIYGTEPVRLVMSVAAAAKVLNESYYQDLPGTLLEGIGKLLATNVKLYVVPMLRDAFIESLGDMPAPPSTTNVSKDLVELDDVLPRGVTRHLFECLRASERIIALKHSRG